MLRILYSYWFLYWGFSWLAYNPDIDLIYFSNTAVALLIRLIILLVPSPSSSVIIETTHGQAAPQVWLWLLLCVYQSCLGIGEIPGH